MLCIKCNQNEENKKSGFCDSCENAERKRINGILYLPAAGLVLSLLIGLASFYGFASEVISYFVKSKILIWYALGGLVVMLVDIIFTAFAAYVFFAQKKVFVKSLFPGICLACCTHFTFHFSRPGFLVSISGWGSPDC